ncbi:Ferric-pseudobactin BN7/BN8 receptor precursor [compost metagenome]
MNWQSSIYRDDVGPNNERFTQKAYAVGALMARYQFSPQLSGTLNLNNVFDKKYYSTAFGGFYGNPRNVMLAMKYQF